VLIIKQAPGLVASGLEKAIGAPEDYNKNLDKGRFPDLDLTIPSNKENSGSQIKDALESIDISEDKPETHQSAVPTSYDDSD
jgi:hypothetical protein